MNNQIRLLFVNISHQAYVLNRRVIITTINNNNNNKNRTKLYRLDKSLWLTLHNKALKLLSVSP